MFNVEIIKLLNLIMHYNAYKKTGVRANLDLDEKARKILTQQLKKYHFSRPTGPTTTICYAPAKSIYFGFGGMVVPCCFNRSFVYGKFPNDSIKDIINGTKRMELQKILDNQDFSHGCEHCRNQILGENFQGVEARLYDRLKKKSGFPTKMIFELDNACNLQCVMCDGAYSSSIQKNTENAPIIQSPYKSAFISQLEPYLKHLKIAKFIGGEPFLIKIYYEIWEKLIIQNPKCFINLQTNGTIFNAQIEDLLKRGKFQIGVSIDSLDNKTFGEIRKNASLPLVLENLDKFIKFTYKNGSFVNISVCPMQQNWKEIPDLVNLCNQKQVFIFFNTVYSEGFSLKDFDSEILEEIIAFYEKAKIFGHSYVSRRNIVFFKDLIHQIKAWYQIKYDSELFYKKNREYTQDEIIKTFENILLSDYPPFENIIRSAVHDLPRNMLLSDHQISMLEKLKKENLIPTLQNETLNQIKRRLHNFIEISSFDLD